MPESSSLVRPNGVAVLSSMPSASNAMLTAPLLHISTSMSPSASHTPLFTPARSPPSLPDEHDNEKETTLGALLSAYSDADADGEYEDEEETGTENPQSAGLQTGEEASNAAATRGSPSVDLSEGQKETRANEDQNGGELNEHSSAQTQDSRIEEPAPVTDPTVPAASDNLLVEDALLLLEMSQLERTRSDEIDVIGTAPSASDCMPSADGAEKAVAIDLTGADSDAGPADQIGSEQLQTAYTATVHVKTHFEPAFTGLVFGTASDATVNTAAVTPASANVASSSQSPLSRGIAKDTSRLNGDSSPLSAITPSPSPEKNTDGSQLSSYTGSPSPAQRKGGKSVSITFGSSPLSSLEASPSGFTRPLAHAAPRKPTRNLAYILIPPLPADRPRVSYQPAEQCEELIRVDEATKEQAGKRGRKSAGRQAKVGGGKKAAVLSRKSKSKEKETVLERVEARRRLTKTQASERIRTLKATIAAWRTEEQAQTDSGTSVYISEGVSETIQGDKTVNTALPSRRPTVEAHATMTESASIQPSASTSQQPLPDPYLSRFAALIPHKRNPSAPPFTPRKRPKLTSAESSTTNVMSEAGSASSPSHQLSHDNEPQLHSPTLPLHSGDPLDEYFPAKLAPLGDIDEPPSPTAIGWYVTLRHLWPHAEWWRTWVAEESSREEEERTKQMREEEEESEEEVLATTMRTMQKKRVGKGKGKERNGYPMKAAHQVGQEGERSQPFLYPSWQGVDQEVEIMPAMDEVSARPRFRSLSELTTDESYRPPTESEHLLSDSELHQHLAEYTHLQIDAEARHDMNVEKEEGSSSMARIPAITSGPIPLHTGTNGASADNAGVLGQPYFNAQGRPYLPTHLSEVHPQLLMHTNALPFHQIATMQTGYPLSYQQAQMQMQMQDHDAYQAGTAAGAVNPWIHGAPGPSNGPFMIEADAEQELPEGNVLAKANSGLHQMHENTVDPTPRPEQTIGLANGTIDPSLLGGAVSLKKGTMNGSQTERKGKGKEKVMRSRELGDSDRSEPSSGEDEVGWDDEDHEKTYSPKRRSKSKPQQRRKSTSRFTPVRRQPIVGTLTSDGPGRQANIFAEPEVVIGKRVRKPTARALAMQRSSPSEPDFSSPNESGVKQGSDTAEGDGSIALSASGAKPKTSPKKQYHARALTFCHQCRRSTSHEKMRCTEIKETGEKCGKLFCVVCVVKRYPDIKFDAYAQSFTCPMCTDTCNCTACTRKRGEEYVPPQPGRVNLETLDIELRGRTKKKPKAIVKGRRSVLSSTRLVFPKPLPANRNEHFRSGTYWGAVYTLKGERVGQGFVGEDMRGIVVKAAGNIANAFATPAGPSSGSHRNPGVIARSSSSKQTWPTGRVFIGTADPSWKLHAAPKDVDLLYQDVRPGVRAYIGRGRKSLEHRTEGNGDASESDSSLSELPSDVGSDAEGLSASRQPSAEDIGFAIAEALRAAGANPTDMCPSRLL
ncbi:uncharacterized protein LAESUDRAFT_521702 [Laetiporus sulphureus 93-53]|uniref:Zinc-finger domain-containing protein n=1 Tax=Laetiporus sulphureus 93-53 TaxID=1314785 RepID=A0A165BEI8_9APHY|nr:uncharacterized protein LAESUDRAFT_521702 [Laetiporus sulphureus 93-53]KZT00884.1 hypothetical protein LAESUDRAFT_521702 [Laetiporus sulphureus 93-53]